MFSDFSEANRGLWSQAIIRCHASALLEQHGPTRGISQAGNLDNITVTYIHRGGTSQVFKGHSLCKPAQLRLYNQLARRRSISVFPGHAHLCQHLCAKHQGWDWDGSSSMQYSCTSGDNVSSPKLPTCHPVQTHEARDALSSRGHITLKHHNAWPLYSFLWLTTMYTCVSPPAYHRAPYNCGTKEEKTRKAVRGQRKTLCLNFCAIASHRNGGQWDSLKQVLG